MRSRLYRCGATRSRLRRLTATPSGALIALLVATFIAAPASAQSTRPAATATPQLNPTGVKADLVELPTADLSNSGLLSTLPLGGLLGLTPEEALALLSPEALATFLGHLTEGATPAQVQQLLAGLADSGLGGEELTALHAIVGALTQGLSTEGLEKLRSDLATLPTGLSEGELGSLGAPALAEVVDGLFGTASPTQLTPVVGDLLGELTWGTGTAGSLAEGLGVPLSTLATALGEGSTEGVSALPMLSSELGSKGHVVGLIDRSRGLALGLLGTEEQPGSGEGEEGAPGGGGSGSGGSGSGSGGGAGGAGSGAGGSSGAGGNGAGGAGGNGLPGSGLTLTITLSPTPSGASPAGAPRGTAKTASIKVLSRRVRGRIATIVLQAPSAGTLVLSGHGVRTTTAKLRHGGRVTLTATLSTARLASLRRAHHRLRVRLRAAFKPATGPSSSATATVIFA